jgi:excisionase family DNA binding protein
MLEIPLRDDLKDPIYEAIKDVLGCEFYAQDFFSMGIANAVKSFKKDIMNQAMLGDDLIVFTTKEIATLLKVNVETVRDWCLQDKISYYRLGEEYRISKKDLIDFLSRHKKKKSNPKTPKFHLPTL